MSGNIGDETTASATESDLLMDYLASVASATSRAFSAAIGTGAVATTSSASLGVAPPPPSDDHATAETREEEEEENDASLKARREKLIISSKMRLRGSTYFPADWDGAKIASSNDSIRRSSWPVGEDPDSMRERTRSSAVPPPWWQWTMASTRHPSRTAVGTA
jgi:hypothetical protein